MMFNINQPDLVWEMLKGIVDKLKWYVQHGDTAPEYMEIPVYRSEAEPLQKLFMVVRIELKLDLKNIKQEHAKFWKQQPALVKTELLIQAHLTCDTTVCHPSCSETLSAYSSLHLAFLKSNTIIQQQNSRP